MTKQEKLIFLLSTIVLIVLYLLSSTDLIIKEKKNDIYPVSIVIGDTTEDYYINFRKGVEKAAADYNVDASFITLYNEEEAALQMELVKREMDDGARAVILAPALPTECARRLDGMVLNGPLVVLGTMFPSDNVKTGISIDYYEAGKTLGTAIASENDPDVPVYIFTKGKQYQYNGEVYDGLMSVLSERGFKSQLFERNTEDTFRSVIEETVYPGSGNAVIAALDISSLEVAADIIGGSSVYGKYISGLYGLGSTTKILNQLDNGIIKGLVVSNEFDEGYLSVQKAIEAIKKEGVTEQIVLDSYYIEKSDLWKDKFEKILYPID